MNDYGAPIWFIPGYAFDEAPDAFSIGPNALRVQPAAEVHVQAAREVRQRLKAERRARLQAWRREKGWHHP